MKAIPTCVLSALLLLAPIDRVPGAPVAPVPGPDSMRHPGVPQGELIAFEFAASKVFPGTTRRVTVYVPRQYDPEKPACVFVDQDGVQWNAPVVLDNLIARGEVPVMVGVFVTPGIVSAPHPSTELGRYNRSLEYDGLGDAYARFILGEVLPAVEALSTADGRPVRLSHSGNDRAIAGSSSGAIAAFTAAWEHPEAFSRVLSSIGTYVGLRGGEAYPTLIRKYEPKPIRVFLQDGSNDLSIYAGDWWMANQTMERALAYSGYEVNHSWDDGGHNGDHMAAILPDALRWIWKDWPKPVAQGESRNAALHALLIRGEEWREAAPPRPRTTGPDGRRYWARASQILSCTADGRSPTTLASGLAARFLVVAHNGNLYATDTAGAASSVWLVTPNGTPRSVDTGLRRATGITLSPDQSLLYVADAGSHWIYSYQVQPDGTLADKQQYYWLHTADTADESHAGGMCCDRNGWLYVATDLGIQVCDQAGRVNAILPLPGGPATDTWFGGERLDVLFAACAGQVFGRRLAATGAQPWGEPNLPAPPKL